MLFDLGIQWIDQCFTKYLVFISHVYSFYKLWFINYSCIIKLSSSLSSTAPRLLAWLFEEFLDSLETGNDDGVPLFDDVEILKGLDGDDILSWEETLVPIFDVLDAFVRFSGAFDVFVIEILDDILDVLEP